MSFNLEDLEDNHCNCCEDVMQYIEEEEKAVTYLEKSYKNSSVKDNEN